MPSTPKLVGVVIGFSVSMGLKQVHDGEKFCFRCVFGEWDWPPQP